MRIDSALQRNIAAQFLGRTVSGYCSAGLGGGPSCPSVSAWELEMHFLVM